MYMGNHIKENILVRIYLNIHFCVCVHNWVGLFTKHEWSTPL